MSPTAVFADVTRPQSVGRIGSNTGLLDLGRTHDEAYGIGVAEELAARQQPGPG